jgi:hypothetical protein
VGADKRQPRGFEPPPWEQEQFNELQRQRAEREAAEAEVEGAEAEAAEAGAAEQPAPKPVATEEPVAPAPAGAEAGAEPQAAGDDGEKKADVTVDDGRMTELMAGLKAEEPGSAKFYWLGNAMAIGLALIGAVLMIWGIVALQATAGKGMQGSLGATVMIIFGAGFIAIAGWVIYRNLQRQGVL